MDTSDKKSPWAKRYGVPAVGLAGALALGAAFGPAVAGAQDTDDGSTEQSQVGKRKGFRPHGKKLDVLEELGLTKEILKAGREGDKTLAQVANENGVETEELVEALVSARLEHLEGKDKEPKLTEEELTEKVTEGVNSTPDELKDKRAERKENRRNRGPKGQLSSEDREALKSAIEAEDYDAAKDLLAKGVDQAVADGKITEEKAEMIKERISERDFSKKPERLGRKGFKGGPGFGQDKSEI